MYETVKSFVTIGCVEQKKYANTFFSEENQERIVFECKQSPEKLCSSWLFIVVAKAHS
jgi:hypothetical protein